MILNPEYQELIKTLTKFFRERDVMIPIQLLKVQEEAGEAAAAFIGFMGLNPRKGITHTPEDVAMELADVVISALIGIEMCGFNADYILFEQEKKTRERLLDQT